MRPDERTCKPLATWAWLFYGIISPIMEDKITIIEGPPPVFEAADLYQMAVVKEVYN
jgi:hypothetical protein